MVSAIVLGLPRQRLLVFLFLFLLGISHLANAKDLGVQGAVFPIEETSLLDVIRERLLKWQKRGELPQKVNALKKEMEERLRHLPNLPDVTPATANRVRFFNPSVVVTQLVTDPRGQILAMPGTVIDPLDNVSLTTPLIFMDFGRQEERMWLDKNEHGLKKTAMIILVGGDGLKAMGELGRRVYYDNHGVLVKRLSLQHTPTVVTQVNHELRLEEVKL